MDEQDEIDRRDMAVQLARLFGYDLSVLEGMTLPQLKEVARVHAEHLKKDPTNHIGGGEGNESPPDEALRALGIDMPRPKTQEMDFNERGRKIHDYFTANEEPLSRLGFDRKRFYETFSECPDRIIKRLR